MTGYNTNGTINPLTVTLDTVYFDGDAANDFKAPDNFNNVQFTFGPGPVSMASFLTADAAVPANFITVTNSVSNSNGPLDCSTAFVYLAGDLTAHASTVTAGTSPTLIAVLQNVVSPLVAGTISYPQQNTPTGTIQVLEAGTVVGTGTLNGRLATITVPNITAGPHTYTANYLGDSHFAALAFGSFTVNATNAAPVASNQSVTVPYNTATPITLTATGTGTLTYTVVTNPTHGTLTGTAPSLTYTPTAGYSGAGQLHVQSQQRHRQQHRDRQHYGAGHRHAAGADQSRSPRRPHRSPMAQASVTLAATASSGLAVTYTVMGPATLSGNTLSFTGAGTVAVTASQAGNASYAAASPVITVHHGQPGSA